jgi:predicted  nucleic acid-binding Zn-ribbon protein
VSAVERCRECGGLFAFLPRGVCAGCLDRREAAFVRVREWLYENRGAPLAVVAEATGVETGLIAQFVREGRLEYVEPDADDLLRRREEEERRARLVRHLQDAAATSTSPSRARASSR